MRKTREIRLTADEIGEFVNAACGCDFDVDVATRSRKHYTVDAKSIVGVMALDLKDGLVVTYSGYNRRFEEELDRLDRAG